MKNTLAIIIVVAAIAGITIYSQSQKTPTPDTKMMEKDTSDMMMKDDTIMEKDEETVMVKDDKVMMEGESMKKGDLMMMEEKPGSFVKYEDIAISDLEGKIVLDFSATWCPSCRTFKKDVEKSLSDIPADLTLVLVDYDSNKDLRKQYGVTQQHTFVQIDNTGSMINKWSGGSTLESLFPNIK